MRNRSGFALLWAIVAIAVLTAITSVAAPYIQEINDRQRVAATAAILKQLATGVQLFNTSVCTNGGCSSWTAPGKVSELAQPLIANDAVNYPRSCVNTSFNATAVTNWNNKGPFVPFFIPTNGLYTPVGRVNEAIPDRTTSQNGPVWLEIPSADANDAAMLDLAVDGVPGTGAGTVQIVVNAGITTIRYSATLTNTGIC